MHVFILVACLLLFADVSAEADIAERGDRLAMLQKIQGSWRTECSPVRNTRSSWQVIKLYVSYTEFKFTTTVYQSRDCIRKASSKTESYSFVLGDSLRIKDGRAVFAVDFKPAGPVSNAVYPFNIVRFEKGKLLIGDDFYKPKGERVAHLLNERPFVRLRSR